MRLFIHLEETTRDGDESYPELYVEVDGKLKPLWEHFNEERAKEEEAA